MKNKSIKVIIIQWILPFVVPLVVVCILLLQFYITSKNTEYQEVQNKLIESAEEYALHFMHELDVLTKAAQPLASVMEYYTKEDIEIAKELMCSMLENSDADQVIMCNLAGEGMTHTGERVDLQSTDYFSAVMGSERNYFYSTDGGSEGNSCIISAMPMSKENETKGILLIYYNISNFEHMINQMQSDMFDLYAVMDGDGDILCGTGKAYEKYPKEDFWGVVLKNKTNDKQLVTANGRFNNNLSGIAKIVIEQEEKTFVFVPLGINEWKMVLGMDYSYLQTLQGREMENAELMLQYFLICVIVYAAIFAVINIFMKIRDAEKKKVLADRADTDLLTGLNNKIATEAKINAYLQDHSDEQALMFVFDVDDFKKINDTMGHAFGDEVLRTLGQRVRAEFRVSDIVGRIGGDEFMIFLKGMKDDNGIRKEADKLERFFKNFRAGEYVKYTTTVSIGAAVYPRDARDFNSLYKAADKALYKAKQRGKNQLAFYNDALEKSAEDK